MPNELVLVERPLSGCALLTLNRPAQRNALSLALRSELATTLDALARDTTVRVLVLTGAGPAFCAGLDLAELGAADGALQAGAAHDPVAALARFAGPVIGAVNGPAVTGGFELALACDLLIASTRASFADTHARVGVLPGWGLSQRLPRLIGPGRAKELSLTGNFLGAAQAQAWGLVNRVVEPEQLLPQALQLAADMLSVLPEMLVACKRLIDDGGALALGEALALEHERSVAWRQGLKAAELGVRGVAVRERGRSQTGAGDEPLETSSR